MKIYWKESSEVLWKGGACLDVGKHREDSLSSRIVRNPVTIYEQNAKLEVGRNKF